MASRLRGSRSISDFEDGAYNAGTLMRVALAPSNPVDMDDFSFPCDRTTFSITDAGGHAPHHFRLQSARINFDTLHQGTDRQGA